MCKEQNTRMTEKLNTKGLTNIAFLTTINTEKRKKTKTCSLWGFFQINDFFLCSAAQDLFNYG